MESSALLVHLSDADQSHAVPLWVTFNGTVSRLSCQILAMKRYACKEITSMDLNNKTIASFQPNVFPGRYNLKLQANEINFENCSDQQYFKNPYRNPSIFFTFGHPYLLPRY